MKKQEYYDTPFGEYIRYLDKVDKDVRNTKEFGSMLILTIVEEVGEMARAYLAIHGRKKTNLAAQSDESYEQELGDLMLAIIRFARIKKLDLNECLMYSLKKIEKRKAAPKK